MTGRPTETGADQGADRAPEVLWRPPEALVTDSRLAAFCRSLDVHPPLEVGDYHALWRWSVDNPGDFWAAVWRHFDVAPGVSYDVPVASAQMPGARWFPGAQLNFADQVLRHAAARPLEPALIAVTEDETTRTYTWRELGAQVTAVAAALRRLGVEPGDRVVAYLPNVAEAVVAFLATASLGAVWSVCAPDIGAQAALDRFGQLEPVVLLTADGYRFRGKVFDRRDAVAHLVAGLPSLRHVVEVPVIGERVAAADHAWVDLLADPAGGHETQQVPFDHPLWVVYSSGTTGLPKGLVHGHGGALLMGSAQAGLQHDLRPGDRACWYTSTSWIMWNAVVSSLLVGATAVLYDGAPLHPSADRLWRLADQHRLTSLGVSPGYLAGCAKAGIHPGRDHDLSGLRVVGVTGSPLPTSGFRWVYDEVGPDVWLQVISGGTDFAAAVVGASPWLPVYAGEMSGPVLGCHVEAWDEQGRPLVDRVGELVVVTPMPSMPLHIWGDHDGTRQHDAYFDTYPGVWRHGDWVTLTSRGTAVIHGRSDSTLNRHGVRMGSSDIYQAAEDLPEVAEALVLGIELDDGGYWLPLFVRLVDGETLTDDLTARINEAVRTKASPRHVPDEVIAAPAIAHTTTGKKLEVPVKRILQGTPAEQACNLGAVDDPEALRWFATFAARRRSTSGQPT